jgi:hypothetical protein
MEGCGGKRETGPGTVYMMFLRFILSFGETGTLLIPDGRAGRAYGEGSFIDAGLVPALFGRDSVGSASE